jgi:hypothetical protein
MTVILLSKTDLRFTRNPLENKWERHSDRDSIAFTERLSAASPQTSSLILALPNTDTKIAYL